MINGNIKIIVSIISFIIGIGLSYGTILTKLNYIEDISRQSLVLSNDNNIRITKIEKDIEYLKRREL